MSKTLKMAGLAAAAALASTPAARAHVAVAPSVAAPGSAATLTFMIGHGCDGQPTTALRVEAPKGVSALEPQAKTGWTTAVERLADGGQAVTWKGGEPLTKADSFAVRVRLPKAGDKLAFAAVQSCGQTTVRWDEAVGADGAKPKHPAPVVTLAAAAPSVAGAAQPAAADERLPKEVKRLADGTFGDGKGLPLYTFNYDTMVGMSHCEDDCAKMWPPLMAPKGAKAFGDWTVIPRPEGTQWAYKTKPVYTYSEDHAGEPAKGTAAPNWTRAK